MLCLFFGQNKITIVQLLKSHIREFHEALRKTTVKTCCSLHLIKQARTVAMILKRLYVFGFYTVTSKQIFGKYSVGLRTGALILYYKTTRPHSLSYMYLLNIWLPACYKLFAYNILQSYYVINLKKCNFRFAASYFKGTRICHREFEIINVSKQFPLCELWPN